MSGCRAGFWLVACALALVALTGWRAVAQEWPAKPIRVVVPFAGGGGIDTLTRVFVQRLSDALGQPVNVENNPGGNGVAAASEVARATADGYTLLVATVATHAIAPAVNRKLAYDPLKDFTPVTYLAASPYVLVISPALPIRTVSELISYGKSRGAAGGLKFATGGSGSLSYLITEYFRQRVGIDVEAVTYKGQSLALPDLMTGQVAGMFEHISQTQRHSENGVVKSIAITSATRSPLAGELPSMAESGIAGFSAVAWLGIVGPPRMPDGIVARLNRDVQRTLAAPEVVQRFHDLGAEAVGFGPERFDAFIRAEVDKWAKVAAAAKPRAE